MHQLYQIPQLHLLRVPRSTFQQLSHGKNAHHSQTTHGHRDWIGAYTHLEGLHEKPSEKVQAFFQEVFRPLPSKATDWNRVEAIVDGLRKFKNDPTASAPVDCKDVVDHVLDAKRGPDYLMASAAAVMIRQLGIPCRLCTGFFASEKRFDRI
ncbi:MAG: transglutaminase domain-containing protein, partial [Pirellula sp.]